MKKVAVTGGICSGKSTICLYLEILGYPVFYSDVIAKNLANTDENLKKEIIELFGNKSYIDNVYNTKYISSIVFRNKDFLLSLNNIYSSYIKKSFKEFCSKNCDRALIFFESAIIFENDLTKEFRSEERRVGKECRSRW